MTAEAFEPGASAAGGASLPHSYWTKRWTLAYYALVLDILRAWFPGSLTEELDRVVTEIWRRAAGARPG